MGSCGRDHVEVRFEVVGYTLSTKDKWFVEAYAKPLENMIKN
jgi:hypothetical protein